MNINGNNNTDAFSLNNNITHNTLNKKNLGDKRTENISKLILTTTKTSKGRDLKNSVKAVYGFDISALSQAKLSSKIAETPSSSDLNYEDAKGVSKKNTTAKIDEKSKAIFGTESQRKNALLNEFEELFGKEAQKNDTNDYSKFPPGLIEGEPKKRRPSTSWRPLPATPKSEFKLPDTHKNKPLPKKPDLEKMQATIEKTFKEGKSNKLSKTINRTFKDIKNIFKKNQKNIKRSKPIKIGNTIIAQYQGFKRASKQLRNSIKDLYRSVIKEKYSQSEQFNMSSIEDDLSEDSEWITPGKQDLFELEHASKVKISPTRDESKTPYKNSKRKNSLKELGGRVRSGSKAVIRKLTNGKISGSLYDTESASANFDSFFEDFSRLKSSNSYIYVDKEGRGSFDRLDSSSSHIENEDGEYIEKQKKTSSKSGAAKLLKLTIEKYTNLANKNSETPEEFKEFMKKKELFQELISKLENLTSHNH